MAKHAFKFYADEDIWEWLQSLDSGERSAKINNLLRKQIEPVLVPVLEPSPQSHQLDDRIVLKLKAEIKDLREEIKETKIDVQDLDNWREEIKDISLLRDFDYSDLMELLNRLRAEAN